MISNKDIQLILKAATLYDGAIDGLMGNKTQRAIQIVLAQERIDAKSTPNAAEMAVQALLNRIGFEAGPIDGKWGYNSQAAYDAWAHQEAKGKPLIVKRVKVSGYAYTLAQKNTPRQRDMVKFYGAVGTNQTQIAVPFPMRLAWDLDTTVSKITCHEAVADRVKAALADILATYGTDRIKSLGLDLFGGCLNVRKMRGGTNWSAHACGAALDFDPDRNQLKWGVNRAQFGKPEYQDYLDIWEQRGATSLLRAANMDGMHFQFMRL